MSPGSTAISPNFAASALAGITREPLPLVEPCSKVRRSVLVVCTIDQSMPSPPLCAWATLALTFTFPSIGLSQPTATLRSGPGCMARSRAGMAMPSTETGLSLRFPPNQGVASLPQPSRSSLPAMLFIFWSSGICRARGFCGGSLEVRRTKKPYSGARIGPFSRSAARKEKLPPLVQSVTMVRATSSVWLVNGCTRRHFAVPR